MPQVTFRIHYATQWGQHLLLERRLPGADGTLSRTEDLLMEHAGDGYWTLWLGETAPLDMIEYRYGFRDQEGVLHRESAFRQVAITGVSQLVHDDWLSPELPDAAFLRQAFAGVIFRPNLKLAAPSLATAGGRVQLTLRAPRVLRGYRICVSGNVPVLGQWDPSRVLVMSGHRYPVWQAELGDVTEPVEFKFGLWSDREKRLISWEDGPNRRLPSLPGEPDRVVISCESFRYPTPWKGAGVAVPVFSLRSARSYGIGEFADLEPFAAWAAGCGMHLVQILPVNDTITDGSPLDSYPYKSISVAALHPVYLNIERAFQHYGLPVPDDYTQRREALNRLREVDYPTVMRDKLGYLRQLYAQVGRSAIKRKAFAEFWRQNGDWLRPYAAFCRLRDRHGTTDFRHWGAEATYSAQSIHAWFKPRAPEYDDVMFYCFVQFHLTHQLDRALSRGRAHGVAFKGDLPIGVGRGSVEAWTEPTLFHLDRQTGAPPDSFAVLGQNWGFPTYDWPSMARDGYAWWRRRFERMSTYFDALRIDHILGFFRIWEIPGHCAEGLLGHFNPARPLRPEEIRAFGFEHDPARFTVPVATDESLSQLFAVHRARLTELLLGPDPDGFYHLRPGFDRAETRAAWYAARCAPAEATAIESGMRQLAFEVLFLEDPDHPGGFHPRVGLDTTQLFASLGKETRAALSRLHEDFFYRRHNHFWEVEALNKLPALRDASRMLICGEDLGMIPDCVPGVLKQLGILSLEVQRMPKRLGQTFGLPDAYPYMSVCTTSTHDMPTLRGWWEEDAESRRRFYREVMDQSGDPPDEGTPDICEFVVQQHLAGASMWCILPLQDWLALDPQLRHPVAAAERINVPADPKHYWRYRMHLTIEDLLHARSFNRTIARMIRQAGRHPGA